VARSMSFEVAFKQHEQVKSDLEKLFAEIPEGIDGLTSLYHGEEDYTCFTAKKLMGRRDKGAQRNAFL
jgi:hypothetical protein